MAPLLQRNFGEKGLGLVMSAIAYRKPLSEGNRHEFDSMDLRDKKQEVISCPQCQSEYVLIYPAVADDELLARYKHEIEAHMGRCRHIHQQYSLTSRLFSGHPS